MATKSLWVLRCLDIWGVALTAFFTAFVAAVFVMTLMASRAEAHDRYWCQHTDRGWYYVTFYVHGYTTPKYRHYHVYHHTDLFGMRYRHSVTTYCPTYY